MSTYRGNVGDTKYVFLIKDDEFLVKYIDILEKVRNSIKKNLVVNLYKMKNI